MVGASVPSTRVRIGSVQYALQIEGRRVRVTRIVERRIKYNQRSKRCYDSVGGGVDVNVDCRR